MSSVLLAGAFGQRNPGVEALLTAFTRALGDWEVVAASTDPDATRADHGVDAVHRFNSAGVAQHVASSAGVVVAGGTLFKALHPASGRQPHALLGRTLALSLAARAFGKPLALVGVGADAVEGRAARGMVREIASRSDLLVLRDEESAQLLSEAGAAAPLRVGADATWTLFEPPVDREPRGERIVVALSHLAGGKRLAPDLAAALAPLVAAGLPVALQPWQPVADADTDDVELAEAIVREVAGFELLAPPTDIFAARAAYADAAVVVGLRFHALIAAAAAGVPFVAVAYEPKMGALARRLDQLCVEPADLSTRLAPAVMQALGAPAPTRAAIATEIDSAEASMRLLRVVLSGGRSGEATRVDGLKLAPEGWES